MDRPRPGYSSTPLAQKLGIRAGHRVLVDGGADVELGPLPPQAVVQSRIGRSGAYDVVLLFTAQRSRLARRWPLLHPRTTQGGALWVCWPKRSARVPTDLDENVVRAFGLAHGRVDVKVAAISDVWSGLKFVVRLTDRERRGCGR
jgi:hypothetical protein